MRRASGFPSPAKGRLILIGLWVALAVAVVVFRKVLLPFAVALVIAYLLEPLVSRLSRVRVRGGSLPRWGAVLLVYAVFFVGLYLFSILAVPQLYAELARLVQQGKNFFNALTPERIASFSQSVEGWLLERGIPLELTTPETTDGRYGLALDLEQALREGLANLSDGMRAHFFDAVRLIRRVAGGVLGFVFTFFFILMVAAFILVDWSQIGRWATKLIPGDRQGDFHELLAAVDDKLSGVVRGQAIICLVNGTLTAIGLVVFGVPFVFVLSMIATVLSAIPIFGTIISSVPIVLFGLTVSFETGLGILLWIVGIHALEAYVLNPKIMGRHAHVHPVIIAFALLAGEATFGFVGALFAVPVTGILVAVFEFAHRKARRNLAEPAPEAAPGPAQARTELPPAQ